MSQTEERLLDTHIHLWPSTATSPSDHGWMTPNHFLAKRHGISDYLSITSPQPTGFIYVETDRYLPSFSPSDVPSSFLSTDNSTPTPEEKEQAKAKLAEWAKQPLEEIKFLRRIAEGQPAEGDGFTAAEAEKMKGCVIYGPLHLAPPLFSTYLEIAEETAGPVLWGKVVGFRYLLQGKGEGVVAKMLSENQDGWVRNLGMLRQGRGKNGWSFDVGVDIHRDGYGPLDAVVGLIRKVREVEESEGVEKSRGLRFVINHLAKHPVIDPADPSEHWLSTLTSLSSDKKVFIKLSGALNEFKDRPTPENIYELTGVLAKYLDHAHECFPHRAMFGSDWPVCNVGGPKGEAGNWGLWRDVVALWMRWRDLSDFERDSVWCGAGSRAYRLVVRPADENADVDADVVKS